MNKLRIVAIDPGASGAYCLLEYMITTTDVSLSYQKVADYPKNSIASAYIEIQNFEAHYIFIEDAKPMGRQGSKAIWSFAKNCGKWEAVVDILLSGVTIPVTFIPPKVWQKAYAVKMPESEGLGAKDKSDLKNKRRKIRKSEHLRIARELFPGLKNRLSRAKDDGRADALLIAKYGLGTINNEK